jgi:cytochrome b pre-mRNA-processing protein 3
MIFRLLKARKDEARVHAIYAAIVAQARQPVFYADLGVQDTVSGRYEMLVLHAFLYMHRLKNETSEAKDMAQMVFDLMFADMDRNLREIGIGDLSVPKKIKKMGQVFYGRAKAYDAALDSGVMALAEAVQRNVYGGDGAKADARVIANYMKASVTALKDQDTAALTSKGPRYPMPDAPKRKLR